MVYVPPGAFLMGQDGKRVSVAGFYIDKCEVTNRQYRAFVEATGRDSPQFWTLPQKSAHDQPVMGVVWHDAVAYATWAGARLPTETEWEKAARGVDGRPYPWGEAPPDDKLAVFGDLTRRQEHAERVGSRPAGASPYGCLDMVGNVWEWCADWYGQPGQERVIRGGAIGPSDYGRPECWSRGKAFPEFTQEHIGFRCAVSEHGGH